MKVDIIIALVALIATLIATPSKKEDKEDEKKIKMAIRVVAFVAFGFAIWKAYDDEKEKDFLKHAISSLLLPTNPQYSEIEKEVDTERDKRAEYHGDCYHSDTTGGMTCFFYEQPTSKRATLVFNRGEVASIYAHQLEEKKSQETIKTRFDFGHFRGRTEFPLMPRDPS